MQSALADGGPRNGVRTALEDALAGREDRFRVVTLEIMEGLAIIVPLTRLAATPPLASLLADLQLPNPGRVSSVSIEEGRRRGKFALHSQALLAGVPIGRPTSMRPFYWRSRPAWRSRFWGHPLPSNTKGDRPATQPGRSGTLRALVRGTATADGVRNRLRRGRQIAMDGRLMRRLAIDGRIVGLDVDPPSVDDPGVTIYRGDARNLAAVLDPAFMSSQQRPFLVIEDLAHDPATCRAALDLL